MYGKVSAGGGPFALLQVEIDPELAKDRAGSTEGQRTEGRRAEITYEYRIFLPRCETYAIRLAGSEVTGVYGPLEYDEVFFNALPSFPYESQADRISWAKDNFSEFAPCDAECEESTLWI